MSSKPVIIVTGAAGFIGSHATVSFLNRGYRVVGVDNFCDFYPRAWKELNVASVTKAGGGGLRAGGDGHLRRPGGRAGDGGG